MKYLLGICAMLLICIPLQAQSTAQIVSTNIISQMFGGELQFDPTATERVSKAVLIELLEANEQLLPPVREQLKAELGISWKARSWQGALARFQAECDEIVVIAVTWVDEESEGGVVTLFVPPNNVCGPLLQSLLEQLYGRYVSGAEEVKRCVEYVCTNASPYIDESLYGCVAVVHLVDASLSCPDNYECPDNGSGCDDLESDFIITITIPE